jgi:hypothetical protein
MELKDKIQKQLLKVKSPSRYIGGEFNSVVKDKSKVDVRFAFCFRSNAKVSATSSPKSCSNLCKSA